MTDRCPVCGGVISELYICIECGACLVCYPAICSCTWEYEPDWEEIEEMWRTEDDDIEEEYEDWDCEHNKWEDARMDYLGAMWGYQE